MISLAVWLKSPPIPPTPPTVISTPYRSEAYQYRLSCLHSLHLTFKDHPNYIQTTVLAAYSIDIAANNGRWWLQSDPKPRLEPLELELDCWWTRKLIGFWRPYRANMCPIATWNCSLRVRWQHVVADYSSVEPLGDWRNTSVHVI